MLPLKSSDSQAVAIRRPLALPRFFEGLVVLPHDGNRCCWNYFLTGRCPIQTECRHDHLPAVGRGIWLLMHNIRLAEHTIDICLPQLTHMAIPTLFGQRRFSSSTHRIRILLDDGQSKHSASTYSSTCGFVQSEYHSAATVVRTQARTLKNIHHKFIVVDRKVVMFGSYNWTSVGSCNDEDVMSSLNPNLVQQYLQRFDELWKKADKNAEHQPESPKRIFDINGKLSNLPCAVFIDPVLPRPGCENFQRCRELSPCQPCSLSVYNTPDPVNILLEVLNRAQKSIDACWYSARHPTLVGLLKHKAYNECVSVRIVSDADSVIRVLKTWQNSVNEPIDGRNNLHVKYKKGFLSKDEKIKGSHARNLMHHKFAVIDGRVVMHGSYNWARFTTLHDDVVVQDDAKIVGRFKKQFERVWNDDKSFNAADGCEEKLFRQRKSR